jgi:hypothetical protein
MSNEEVVAYGVSAGGACDPRDVLAAMSHSLGIKRGHLLLYKYDQQHEWRH